MRLITVIYLMLAGTSFAQSDTTKSVRSTFPQDITEDSSQMIYNTVDEAAHFPGGQDSLRRYLRKNIQRPGVSTNKSQNTTLLKFIVHKDGSISEIKILESVAGCPECDAEAKRVVGSMPKWIPGIYKGEAVDSYGFVRVRFIIP